MKEVIAEKFPNLEKDLDIQGHEPKRPPYIVSAKRLPKIHYNETEKLEDGRKNLQCSQGKK